MQHVQAFDRRRRAQPRRRGAERLDRKIAYGPSDLLGYAPVSKAHVAEGGITVADLCAAAIDWSDNTAANLILQTIGGPQGFTRFARSLGDEVTRLDRNEPSLNESTPGDEHDTTSPRAMAGDVRQVLLGDTLSEASRRQPETWLIGDKVGGKRLRAGLPPSWGIGDKTGSGEHGTANTIAIIRPPGQAPIIAAVYYTEYLRADGRAQRDPQGDRDADRGNVLSAGGPLNTIPCRRGFRSDRSETAVAGIKKGAGENRRPPYAGLTLGKALSCRRRCRSRRSWACRRRGRYRSDRLEAACRP